jgi:predicted histone-like DNA-binding protein
MVNFLVKQKVNPLSPLDPRKYYAIAKAAGEIDMRSLANQISKETTLGTPDVMAVLEALLQDIPTHLADGKIVRLGAFGSYRLTLSGDGAENLEEYHSSMIKKTNLHFRPGKVFSDVLKNVEFRKVS